MIIIGLTGSIGMGKSTTAKLLRDLGAPFHDADAAVHQLMVVGGKAVEPISKLFPSVIVKDNMGAPYIDRKALGKIVFGASEKLKALEDVLHPLVRAESDAFLKDCRQNNIKMAVLDIPLLFETGGESRVDIVMCVSAPFEVQKQRVLARENMTEEKFNHILKQQLPDAEKRARADYVVMTDKSIEDTKQQLVKIMAELQNKPAPKFKPPTKKK